MNVQSSVLGALRVRAPLPGANRISFISRYKGFLAVLVVLIHTGITYGGAGSWYFSESHDVLWLKVLTTCIASFSQSFVLGAFFFLSAYFLPFSLERKGSGRILLDRLMRFGIPYVLFYFLMNPLLVMAIEAWGHGRPIPFGPYFGSGPLWFLEALFIFTLVYVAGKLVLKRPRPLFRSRGLPSTAAILAYILITAALGFVARIAFPIGWTFHNLQFGFFPMYILLFAAGIKAGKEGWLDKIAERRIGVWTALAVISLVIYLPLMILGGALSDSTPFLGGLTWQNAMYAAWEAVAGTSFFIITIVLFARAKWRSHGAGESFGEASYGIYLFQALTIILLSLALKPLALHPALKWIMLSVGAVCVGWGLTAALKKVPRFRRVL